MQINTTSLTLLELCWLLLLRVILRLLQLFLLWELYCFVVQVMLMQLKRTRPSVLLPQLEGFSRCLLGLVLFFDWFFWGFLFKKYLSDRKFMLEIGLGLDLDLDLDWFFWTDFSSGPESKSRHFSVFLGVSLTFWIFSRFKIRNLVKVLTQNSKFSNIFRSLILLSLIPIILRNVSLFYCFSHFCVLYN